MKSKQLVNVNGRVIRMALATALAVGGATGVNSYAGTSTANLAVTANVSSNCTISTGAVAFNTYDPIVANASSALDATGTVTVTCTLGISPIPKITLGQGANAGAGSTDAAPVRRMVSGSSYLSYALYSDAGRSTVWGNTDSTGVGRNPLGVADTVTVWGRVPAGQNVPVGNYSDTVVATVTF